MRVLVSACLLGENCKYNGGNNFSPAVAEYLREKDVLPVCPERLRGEGNRMCDFTVQESHLWGEPNL